MERPSRDLGESTESFQPRSTISAANTPQVGRAQPQAAVVGAHSVLDTAPTLAWIAFPRSTRMPLLHLVAGDYLWRLSAALDPHALPFPRFSAAFWHINASSDLVGYLCLCAELIE
jgi:hypothetical protein